MKKKVKFNKIKDGEYFKYYSSVYRKGDDYGMAYPIIGVKQRKYFWSDTKVIPVTVTIKVKEK